MLVLVFCVTDVLVLDMLLLLSGLLPAFVWAFGFSIACRDLHPKLYLRGLACDLLAWACSKLCLFLLLCLMCLVCPCIIEFSVRGQE